MFENNEWMFVCLFSFVFADVKIDWRNQRLSIGWEHFFFSGSVGSHQCDQMARLIFKIWPFEKIKICPNVPKYLQDFGICYVDPSKFGQKLLKLSQSGQISPHLVTLVGTQVERLFLSRFRDFKQWRPRAEAVVVGLR